ncbi:hypothetical protein SAMN05444682_102424 [Parapedobacter indicus]|uniref:Peptidase family M48 n=2 Tax=Parapedobacter indicus TaxID=1477437 RepID=A0A1I3FNU1_9SPHI|nr:hypothetical protein CLV26_102424 [Parapedobacter indicus]SFI12915.1 hypothetical protein SAMN05444682_102424 [Parapedobacter indicus]
MNIFLLALFSTPFVQQDSTEKKLLDYKCNKEIPAVIEKQTLIALSHYPELKNTRIRFTFSRKLKRSVMAARPVVASLLRKREKRVYDVLINPVFKLEHSFETIRQIPDSVMIGWIGHELGHIMDYEKRSTWGLLGFGVSYGVSKKYIRKAERIADRFAVEHGLGEHLVATKSFILDHTELPEAYQEKIATLYLSPDDIVELVAELETERDEDKKEKLLLEEENIVNEAESELNGGQPSAS